MRAVSAGRMASAPKPQPEDVCRDVVMIARLHQASNEQIAKDFETPVNSPTTWSPRANANEGVART